MANPLSKLVPLVFPQTIQLANGGRCFLCGEQAVKALRAGVSQPHQIVLREKIFFHVVESGVVAFSACSRHGHALYLFRVLILKNKYRIKI